MADASNNGVAQEAVQNIKRVSKTMTEAEARQHETLAPFGSMNVYEGINFLSSLQEKKLKKLDKSNSLFKLLVW